jgi:DME family drug/metabolite transporter
VSAQAPSRPQMHVRRRGWGYALVAASYLIMGSIGALVDYASAPESFLVLARMVTAGVVLGVIFARRRPLAGLRAPGLPSRLLLMAALDTGALMLFFLAIRHTDVALAMFLLFVAPVWVAVVAPRLLHTRTEPVVYLALVVALAGLATILVPTLTGKAVNVSSLGLLFGAAAGLCYAVFQIVMKDLTRRLNTISIVLTETILDTILILPLALWQTVGAGYHLTGRDLLVGLILGVVCTALAYTMWTEGVARVRVQHSSILGYLEPVSAPLYALLLLGERPGGWTLAGGALIIVAGALVIAFGEPEEVVPA